MIFKFQIGLGQHMSFPVNTKSIFIASRRGFLITRIDRPILFRPCGRKTFLLGVRYQGFFLVLSYMYLDT